MRICVRAATRRDDVVAVLAATVEDDSSVTGGRASRVRSVGDGVVALPAAAAPLSDRVRVLRWGTVAAANLVS